MPLKKEEVLYLQWSEPGMARLIQDDADGAEDLAMKPPALEDIDALLVKALEPSETCRLKYLVLGGNNLGDAGADRVTQLLRGTPVEILDLYFNQVTVVGMEKIAINLGASTRGFGEADMGKDADDYDAPTRIHTLRLGYNDLEDDGAKAATALFSLKGLLELNLNYNDITSVGGEALRDSVRHCATLKKLSLTGNAVPQPIIDSIEAVLLFNDKQLQVSTSFRESPS